MNSIFNRVLGVFKDVRTKYFVPRQQGDAHQELAAELADFFAENNVKLQSLTERTETTEYIQFELIPERGQSVRDIKELLEDLREWMGEDDITLEIPLEGSSGIGINMPRGEAEEENNPSGLLDILKSEEFKNTQGDFLFVVGHDMHGKPVFGDIAKMPHLLVAGSTGSGKSVFVDVCLNSLLCQYTPEQFRLILADTKGGMNFNLYEEVPHLYTPVITDYKLFFETLRNLEKEIESRYIKMSKIHVRNLAEYNARVAEEDKLFRILVVVDDLADMIEKAEKETKERIIRITQMARASGVHLCIVTQSPNKKVLPPEITYNLMGKIALSVTDVRESRIVLDDEGAQKLRGKGDLLFMQPGFYKPVHAQGVYISKEEIEGIVAQIKKH